LAGVILARWFMAINCAAIPETLLESGETLTGSVSPEDQVSSIQGADPPGAIEAWIEAMLRQCHRHGERPFAEAVAHLESTLIRLVKINGRLVHAAELLGISRTTLRKKMRDHGIVVKAGPGKA